MTKKIKAYKIKFIDMRNFKLISINKMIKIILFTYFTLFFSQGIISQTKMDMDNIIKVAVENNQSLKTARLNIDKENATGLRSFNIPKPEIFVEYEGVQGSLSNAESRKIGFLQQFEFPTNYFLRSDMQNSQISVAEQELNAKLNELKAELKMNYNRLHLLYELIRSSEENLNIYSEFLNTAEKKYEAGETSNLEVLGAKVNKIKFQNEITNYKTEIISVQSELRNLMNVNYDVVPTDEMNFKELNLNRASILNNAETNNPEIKVAGFQKEKFSNKISLSKNELLPDISFKYFRQKIGGQNDYWGMEIGLGVPLWFWWEQSGNIKESNYEYQIATSEELSLKKSVENQTDIAFSEYENSLRQVKFFKEEALSESEEILRQSKISYVEGEIGYVEYLQALNLAYETMTQYLNAVYTYNQSIIKLEKLTASELK